MKAEIFSSDAALKNQIDDFFNNRFDAARVMIERIIERNILYYMGEQYIEFLVSTGQFRKRQENPYVPTPVSNEIREYVRSVKATLLNQRMTPRVWPNTDEREDIQAAEAGQALLVSMDQAHSGRFQAEKEKLAIMLTLSGTAFMRCYADMDGGAWLPDGKKTGEVGAECEIPFNVRLDRMGERLEQKRWIGIQHLKDREWVEDTYKVKIDQDESMGGQVDYQRHLANLVASVSPWKGRPISGHVINADQDDLIIFREVEFAPMKQYPDGLYVIAAGGKIIKKYPRLPIKSTREEWHYSITDFHFNHVPGRFWSDPGVSDLISPQNIINEIDQALCINRKGMGLPKLLTPGDVGLKRIGIGAHGFITLQYNPIMGLKPELKEGIPLPQQVLAERSLQKEQMQDASGDPKNVLRGQQPSANASGVLTEGLRETAERGRYPDLDRFNRSLTQVYKKRLLIAQEVMTEQHLIKTLGRGNKIKVMKFKASDLRGNTDVRLELDSGLLSTKNGQAQMMLNMIQAGFFKEGEVSQTVRQEVLQRMGISTFSNETNGDVERAENENMNIAAGELTSVMLAEQDEEGGYEILSHDPLFEYDDHTIHYEIHRKYIISPEFSELPEQIQTVLLAHAGMHRKMQEEKQPDFREYIQIDKIFPYLTESERAQVLQTIGIQPGEEPQSGLPTADNVIKSKQRMVDSEQKNRLREAELNAKLNVDFSKFMIGEQGKRADAEQARKDVKKQKQ